MPTVESLVEQYSSRIKEYSTVRALYISKEMSLLAELLELKEDFERGFPKYPQTKEKATFVLCRFRRDRAVRLLGYVEKSLAENHGDANQSPVVYKLRELNKIVSQSWDIWESENGKLKNDKK